MQQEAARRQRRRRGSSLFWHVSRALVPGALPLCQTRCPHPPRVRASRSTHPTLLLHRLGLLDPLVC